MSALLILFLVFYSHHQQQRCGYLLKESCVLLSHYRSPERVHSKYLRDSTKTHSHSSRGISNISLHLFMRSGAMWKMYAPKGISRVWEGGKAVEGHTFRVRKDDYSHSVECNLLFRFLQGSRHDIPFEGLDERAPYHDNWEKIWHFLHPAAPTQNQLDERSSNDIHFNPFKVPLSLPLSFALSFDNKGL